MPSYPLNANVLNVVDFGVIPNLSESNTAAIAANTQKMQEAISLVAGSGRYLFIPRNSVILIDNELDCKDSAGNLKCYTIFCGEDKHTSVLKIKDNCSNFQAGSNKSIIKFNSQNPSHPDGSGNQAFNNTAEFLTLNTGLNNPGATAVNYMVNNYGRLYEINFIGNNSLCAISMLRYGSGSGLIKKCNFEGFQRHIDYRHWEYSMVIEECDFRNSLLPSIRVNDGNTLTVHRCGFYLYQDIPCIELLDQAIAKVRNVYFSCNIPNPTSAPIKLVGWNAQTTTSIIYLWNYSSVADVRGTKTPSQPTQFSEPPNFTSKPAQKLFDTSTNNTFFEGFKQHPVSTPMPIEGWQFIGAPTGLDDTDIIQAALNSGKADIYPVSGARYFISRTLRIPATVRRIHGLWCHLTIQHGNTFFRDSNNQKPIWLVEEGDQPLELMNIEAEIYHDAHMAGAYTMQNNSSRDIVFTNYSGSLRGSYHNGGTAPLGEVFIENTTANLMLNRPQTVHARQLNPEDFNTKIYNNGGKVQILGLKTENAGVCCRTINGGTTEIFGGQIYPTHQPPTNQACFEDENSSVFYSINSTGSSQYPITVRSKKGAEIKELPLQNEHGAGFDLGFFKH